MVFRKIPQNFSDCQRPGCFHRPSRDVNMACALNFQGRPLFQFCHISETSSPERRSTSASTTNDQITRTMSYRRGTRPNQEKNNVHTYNRAHNFDDIHSAFHFRFWSTARRLQNRHILRKCRKMFGPTLSALQGSPSEQERQCFAWRSEIMDVCPETSRAHGLTPEVVTLYNWYSPANY